MDTPFTRCNGIQYHTDTVWKRCQKAKECQRYIRRHDQTCGEYIAIHFCNTVDFEHWVKAP